MRNFRLLIEYDGGRYDGWQRLGKGESSNTIENKIKDVLNKMAGCEVEFNAAARTETGVHAYGQVANFKCETDMSCMQILHYLNRYLPRDIAVTNVKEMPERFHASLNAKKKTYLYRIDVNEIPDVFERHYKYNAFKTPNVAKMKEACDLLVGKHDFAKFTTAKKNKTTIKEIYEASILDDGTEVQIRITANDFMHNMARLLFGTLLLVGKGELEPSSVLDMLGENAKVTPDYMAEPCGMFLERVDFE